MKPISITIPTEFTELRCLISTDAEHPEPDQDDPYDYADGIEPDPHPLADLPDEPDDEDQLAYPNRRPWDPLPADPDDDTEEEAEERQIEYLARTL